jgi:hypothetical protein
LEQNGLFKQAKPVLLAMPNRFILTTKNYADTLSFHPINMDGHLIFASKKRVVNLPRPEVVCMFGLSTFSVFFQKKTYKSIYKWQAKIAITVINKQIVPEYSGFFFKQDSLSMVFRKCLRIIRILPEYSG